IAGMDVPWLLINCSTRSTWRCLGPARRARLASASWADCYGRWIRGRIGMIDRLLEILNESAESPDAIELADALWLAERLPEQVGAARSARGAVAKLSPRTPAEPRSDE